MKPKPPQKGNQPSNQGELSGRPPNEGGRPPNEFATQNSGGSLDSTEDLFATLMALRQKLGPVFTEKTPALGPYQLLEKIGQGGMGAVFRAQHTRLNRIVAVKVLPPHLTRDPEALSRFDREMKAVGAIEHPNIVRATDADEFNGIHYLVMEFLEGEDLLQRVRRGGTMSVPLASQLISTAAAALHHIHEKGLVHRDIKPNNLFLTSSGVLKVLDLGLSRLSDRLGSESPSSTGKWLGTPDYMAPEQWTDSKRVERPTDLYALGCTLYFLLHGSPPFSGKEYSGVATKMKGHVYDQPPKLGSGRVRVPESLEAIYQQLLQKKPEKRFRTGQEVVEALRHGNVQQKPAPQEREVAQYRLGPDVAVAKPKEKEAFPPPPVPNDPNVVDAEIVPSPFQWFYADQQQQKQGPIHVAMLREMFRSGKLPFATYVCQKGSNTWKMAKDVPAFAGPPQVAKSSGCLKPILLSVALIAVVAASLYVAFLLQNDAPLPPWIPADTFGQSHSPPQPELPPTPAKPRQESAPNRVVEPIITQRYGGVAIGWQGVKVSAIEIETTGSNPKLTIFDLENRTVDARITRLKDKEFNPRLIEEVAEATKSHVAYLETELTVPKANIQVVFSSSVPFVANGVELVDAIQQRTGISPGMVSAQEEAELSATMLIPVGRRQDTVLLDLGLSNLKFGEFQGTQFNTVTIPTGQLVLSQAINEAAGRMNVPRSFALARTVAKEKVGSELKAKLPASVLRPKLNAMLQPESKSVLLSGTCTWALTTIALPAAAAERFPRIRRTTIDQYWQKLESAGNAYPVVNFSQIADRRIRDAGQTDYDHICGSGGKAAMYTPAELQAGAALLLEVADVLDLATRPAYFDRHGVTNWMNAKITPEPFRHLLPAALGRDDSFIPK